jgi:DNA repair ATPase RecN
MSARRADAGDEAGDGRQEQAARGLRARLSGRAEDAIGRLADDLLENALINSALQGAFTAREKMAQAQEAAMEALNLPSASTIERLERRLRSISQRLEQLEDGIDRLDQRLRSLSESRAAGERAGDQLDQIESRLEELSRDVAALRREASTREPALEAERQAAVPEG